LAKTIACHSDLVQQFAKPKIKKHRAKNNPKPTVNCICEVCGKPFAECHEIFFGPLRQLSIKYGIQAYLCNEHHQGKFGPHQCKRRDLELKQQGQAWFERLYGHDEFMRIFGRNYL
jgi:hypothetical protein